MGGLFSAPKPPPLPPPPPPPVTREDPAIKEAQLKQKMAAKLRGGRKASILTSQSEEGLGGEEVERPQAETLG